MIIVFTEPDLNSEPFKGDDVQQRERDRLVELQQHFLPQTFPDIDGISWSARYLPSKLVGGDYYDVFLMDGSRYAIVMADISGHGYAAAIVMAMTQMAVKEFSPGVASPSQALTVINKKLQKHMLPQHFVTMFFGVLDIETNTLRYSSAGHPAAMIYRASEETAESLPTEPDYPLCTFPTSNYPEASIQLKTGDVCLFFTDGVFDSVSSDGQFYGEERLLAEFERSAPGGAESAVHSIVETVSVFRGDADQLDDFTVLAMSID